MEALIAKLDSVLYPIVCDINTYLSNYILVFLLIGVGLWYSIPDPVRSSPLLRRGDAEGVRQSLT